MNKQTLIIGGVVLVALVGFVSLNIFGNKLDSDVVKTSRELRNERPPFMQDGEQQQVPTAEEVDRSVFNTGDRVIIETDESGAVAEKITLLTQDGGFTPPTGEFSEDGPLQMAAGRENTPIPGGGPRGGAPTGLMGEITALSDASITVSGRNGETTLSLTSSTVFESR